MTTPPRILDAHITGPLLIDIAWSTGETLSVDLSDCVRPPFDVLEDPAFFARMKRDEWGHGLDWPDGLDLGADTLYELCRRQAGLPTISDFNAWMVRNGMTLAAAAETLGMTTRKIADYLTGSRPIPKVVGLACKAIDMEHSQIQ